MIEVWLPGVLALVGALGGVLLSTWLARRFKGTDDRRRRLEDAYRAVVQAISVAHFALQIKTQEQPLFVTDEELRGMHSRQYLRNLELLAEALREAKHAVGLLIPDGIDVGDSWRGDKEMEADLERLYVLLSRELGLREPRPLPGRSATDGKDRTGRSA